LAEAGRKGDALQILDDLNRMAAQRYVPPESRALVHAGLGETENALDWLEKAFDERSSYMIYLSVDPRLDRLRLHPRFVRMRTAVLQRA
jgi:hypothetical protein